MSTKKISRTFRCSEADYALFKLAAVKDGNSITTWIYRRCMGLPASRPDWAADQGHVPAQVGPGRPRKVVPPAAPVRVKTEAEMDADMEDVFAVMDREAARKEKEREEQNKKR